MIVDLAALVASGDATFANIGPAATHTLNADGTISGGANPDGSIGQVIFNFPVTSVGAVGAGSPNAGNYDGVEVGLDNGVFNIPGIDEAGHLAADRLSGAIRQVAKAAGCPARQKSKAAVGIVFRLAWVSPTLRLRAEWV